MRFKHFALTLFLASALRAETLILDCIGDGYSSGGPVVTKSREIPMPGLMVVAFRTWDIAGWRIDNATLFLHAAKGAPPAKLEIAAVPSAWSEIEPPRIDQDKLKFVYHDVSMEPQNWATIQVQPSLIEAIASGKAYGLALRFQGAGFVLHARESTIFAPKLYVSGGRR